MKEISLYGAGGHGHAAVALIKSLGEYRPVVVYDDNPQEGHIQEVPVKRMVDQPLSTKTLCVTIGNNRNRKKIVSKSDSHYPKFIHKSVQLYPSVYVDMGTLVHPGVVLDAEVNIGKFCIINNHATLSHNVTIGDYVHIAIHAAIAGGVTIGEGTLIGAGSIILPGVTIGKWVTIGAGSVVTKDIPDDVIAYGNPAVIKKHI